MHTIRAYIELSRPINGVIAFISVFLGALLASGGLQPLFPVGIIAVAALLLLSAGNAINDYCDVEIDRVNKPHRPIPSGRIDRPAARNFAFSLMIVSVCLGILVNWAATLIALLVALLLVLYAIWLKRTPLLGNVVVGLLTALVFVAGGVAVNALHGTWVAAMFAFLFTTAREIVKDIEDVEGDQAGGAHTLPLLQGIPTAKRLAQMFMAAVILLSPLPTLLSDYGLGYLLVVIPGVDLVLLYLIRCLEERSDRETAAMVQRWMKADIFVGLLAIYLGRIV